MSFARWSMHERSLVRSLLAQVQALAAEHPADRVAAIRVRIGEFSGVEPELLQSAYEELAAPRTCVERNSWSNGCRWKRRAISAANHLPSKTIAFSARIAGASG